MPRSSAWQA